MKITTTILAAATGGLLLIGCGGSGSPQQLDGWLDGLGSDIETLQAEQNAHHHDVMAASSMGEIHTLEQMHDQECADLTADMHDMMDRMETCYDVEGNPPHMTGMTGMMDLLDGELSHHHIAMAEAMDMAFALGEETRHHAAMTDMLHDMMDHHDGLEPHGEDYDCPMDDGHMHDGHMGDGPMHGH